jgi:POB3-like N-terminal PH domain
MSEPVTWKHIGLHGYAVGTLALTKDSILWKSAVSGRDDDASATSTRKISAAKLKSAVWTVFGKTGLVRLSTSDPKQHEWRLDGFPVADFDVLAATLSSLYEVELDVLNMSAAGAQYGITKVKGKLLTLNHCTLQDDLNEEGQEFEVAVDDQICSLDLTEVSQCVLPGNNRNELELQFPETDTMEAGTDQLGTRDDERVYIALSSVRCLCSRFYPPRQCALHFCDSLTGTTMFVALCSGDSHVHSTRPRF